MFGYIKPFKPDLKICEYEIYKSIYCSLCHQLGNSFGVFSRLTLSYDFTFLAMLLMSLSDNEEIKYDNMRCPLNPLKKIKYIKKSKELLFASDCAMILLYYKIKDSFYDNGFFEKFKAIFIYPIVSFARKKAINRIYEIDEFICNSVIKQKNIEQKDFTTLDEAANPTAEVLSKIFQFNSINENQKRILSYLGYLIGRYVYICDALDDIEQDIKLKNYNPLLSKTNNIEIEQIKKEALYSINLTMATISSTYELLDIKNFKSILDNIIYQGLSLNIKDIMHKKENK